jgi:hypothetical protein
LGNYSDLSKRFIIDQFNILAEDSLGITYLIVDNQTQKEYALKKTPNDLEDLIYH